MEFLMGVRYVASSSQQKLCFRVTVNTVGGPGASSPTKSMSSGSMSGVAGGGGGIVGIASGLVPSEPNVASAAGGGREVLTVNVNQINQG